MMTEKNWTLGPWQLTDKEDPFTSSIESCDGTLVVAGEMDGWMFPFAAAYDIDQGEANARLVAAAPELYAALEELVDWIDGMPVGDGHGMADEARAALAKARGEEAE